MNNHSGEVYGLWTITDKAPVRVNKTTLYECQCSKCHNYSFLKLSNIKRSKSRNCKNCTPDYHFIVSNGQAVGTLPDNSTFIIDEEDIQRVSQIRWFYNSSSGYITTNSTCTQSFNAKLHRFILDLESSDDVIVDHINRIKTDCRKRNLRIVSISQNTLNKTLRKSSSTGYMGVSAVTSEVYKASIQISGKGIFLGKSKNIIECAQMYNVASSILFGEFCGERNNVPEPSKELVARVTEICSPYIALAQSITKPIKYMKGVTL